VILSLNSLIAKSQECALVDMALVYGLVDRPTSFSLAFSNSNTSKMLRYHTTFVKLPDLRRKTVEATASYRFARGKSF
jgi:hypothetical protein